MIIPSLVSGLTGTAEIPRIDIMPTASFARSNLLSRDPHSGKYEINEIYKPKMMNASLGINIDRRFLNCTNTLRTTVGKAAKEKQTVKPTLAGIGRNLTSLPILIPTDSHVASKNSKLAK